MANLIIVNMECAAKGRISQSHCISIRQEALCLVFFFFKNFLIFQVQVEEAACPRILIDRSVLGRLERFILPGTVFTRIHLSSDRFCFSCTVFLSIWISVGGY